MIRLYHQLHASIGSKIIVALTGLALAGFVVFHMIGNLQIFEGREALNAYAAFLRDMPILLWTARAGLVGLAGIHIWTAIKLAIRNREARPLNYTAHVYRQASFASRTMAVSGTLLLLFIIFHLLHLTFGVVDRSFIEGLDLRGQRDVYGKMIHAFGTPWLAAVYLAGQAVLGLHVSHGITSSFQTLGLEHPALNRMFKAAGPAIALLVVLGNVVIVLAVLLGVVR
jgi:succinate dehydrogenase / fumarate reductase, cytochrome b subunit